MITSVQRMRVSFLSFQIKASENVAFCRAFRCFDPRGGSANRRAAPAFEILMLAPVRRFFPEPRQRLNGSWRCARVLHPSEDLSELPPLREAVAGQEYHYLRTRSLRGSLPKLLLDGWVPLVTLLGRLYTAGLYRWSSRILRIAVPFLARPLDVMSVAGYVLFKLHESVF